MKYLKQFCIILFISFIGELLHAFLPLPIPANIYGIAILFIALLTKILKVDDIKETGYFLIEIMPLMFVPLGVELIKSWGILRANWLSYLVITVVTTILVMGISGKVTQIVIKHSINNKGNTT